MISTRMARFLLFSLIVLFLSFLLLLEGVRSQQTCNSTSLGCDNTASGEYSTAMGYNTTASGDASTAMGWLTTAQSYSSLAIGRYNVISGNNGSWIPSDPLFVVGNGREGSPSNALTLLKTGDMTIAGKL